MEKLNRCIHFDFHTPDGVYDFGEAFDAEDFAETLARAHVSYINAAAQCNFGYTYYPSKVSVTYPQMKGDMLGDILSACHKRGIGVSAYINVGINNAQSALHMDWLRVSKDGVIWNGDVAENNAFTSMCYYTGYKEFLFNVIKEVLEYEVDGIFLDCLSSAPCYCMTCRKAMKEAGVDVADDAKVRQFAYDSFIAFIEEIREIVPENVRLTYNGAYYDAEQSLASHIEVECLPGGFGGWHYDYADPQLSYARNLSDTLYMSGRFHASWGDFGGVREKASLENEMFCALCNNVGFSVGDHLHPSQGLNKNFYKTIGQVFERLKQYEKWTKNTVHCADIGVVRNKAGANTAFLPDELCGVSRMLNELKYGFEIINDDMDFSPYKVLILTDTLQINDVLKKKISDHIKNGGYVLSSGWAGYDNEKNEFVLPEYDFIECCGTDEDTATCYRITDEKYGDTTFSYSDYSRGVLIKAKNGGGVLAERINHYFDDRWDRPYFDYRWTTSHLYTYLPPEKPSGYSAVVQKGNICHIAFEVFNCYYRYSAVFQKKLVSAILKAMLKNPLVITEDIASTARLALSQGEGYHLLHVKVTYPEARGKWFKVVENHNKLPSGAKVSVRGRYAKAVLVPEEQELICTVNGDYTEIILPEIEGYGMICLS